jgi:hypothetical protein
MATSIAVVTVTTTAQSIVSVDNVEQYITLHANGSVYIGASNVTDSNGIHIQNGATLQLTIQEGCDLWAVTASGTNTLRVLKIRVE